MDLKIICFIILISFSSKVLSQTDDYIDKIKEINEFLFADDYNEARYLLLDLEKDGYNNANINYKFGLCYLNSAKEKELAIKRFESAVKDICSDCDPKNPEETKAPLETYLLLGDAYMINDEYDKAQKVYKTFLQQHINDNQKSIAQKKLKECLIARLMIQNPVDVKFQNAGTNINSELANFNVCLSGNGERMVFTKKLKFYDAVYYSTLTDSGWSLSENITNKIGSDGEFIPTSLSYDGTSLLLYSYSFPNGYDIYESKYIDNKWRKLKKLEEPINSKYNELDACYSPDGLSILFSSNRPDGYGGYDLYKANISQANNQVIIKSLGNMVNTIGDEKSPELINDGNTLVYSSNYGLGMGGSDYYYSNLNDSNQWTLPLNLGYPFNTSDNNNDLSLINKGNSGAVARYTQKGHTDTDILLLTFNNFGKFRVIPVKGKLFVNGSNTLNYAERTIIVIDQNVNDTAYIIESEPDGSYSLDLYPGDFNLVVKNNDTIESEQKFTVSPDLSVNSYNLTTHIIEAPEKPEVKFDTIFISDILFEFDKSTISEKEKQQLFKILPKLKMPEITSITLVGYTDAIGTVPYNMTLSLQRANYIKNILISNGLNDAIIKTIGKGNTDFIAKNTIDGKDCPKGRLYNRRVEINIQLEKPGTIIISKSRVPDIFKVQ